MFDSAESAVLAAFSFGFAAWFAVIAVTTKDVSGSVMLGMMTGFAVVGGTFFFLNTIRLLLSERDRFRARQPESERSE